MLRRSINKEFYGDSHRWFVGVVINSSPPAGFEGRVKVRIHGIHNRNTGQVQESDLPWAQVVIPTTEGGVSGIGRSPQLLPGAQVFGIFLDGESSQMPLVLGSIPRVEYPTDVQAKSTKNRADSNFEYKFNQERKQDVTGNEDYVKNDTSREGSKGRRRSEAMRFFIDNGYTARQAAGIVGNLEAVSKFVIYDDENIIRQGVAGWQLNSSRWNELVEFSSKFDTKVSWKKYSIQLQFILYELRTNFTVANYKLQQTESIDGENGSAAIFQKYYLRREDVDKAQLLANIAFEGSLR